MTWGQPQTGVDVDSQRLDVSRKNDKDVSAF